MSSAANHQQAPDRPSPVPGSRFPVPGSRRILWVLLIAALLGGYWLLPIRGQVVILTDPQRDYPGVWPQIWVEPPAARPGDEVMLYVRDNAPWPYVRLLIDGSAAQRDETYAAGSGPWTWRWRFAVPERPAYEVVFYHDCHTGCVERARIVFGARALPASPTPPPLPTKLGVVFADAARDWHGRAGWDVELTYAQQPDDPDLGIDGLARRVQQATQRGLRVLVRVAYDRRQALPPAGDELALARYLAYCARLVRDDRLNAVYGYIIGSGFNTAGENTLAPDRPTTPEWYARAFNGYGLAPARSDNVVQTMRGIDPHVRVLVGPVTPWATDQNGAIRASIDQPWLNYFNTLVASLDAAAREKSGAGVPFAAPDGFALQAPGRPAAPAVAGQPEREPASDLRRPEWGAAQAGFRVYRDWLTIVNHYPTTRGLPAYITSTNTWTIDTQVPPAQNYPAGWLTAALTEINREPQVQALCWFVDVPLGEMWVEFSLSRHPGRLYDAAEEFDRLLRQ
jgi:hypothetical protein